MFVNKLVKNKLIGRVIAECTSLNNETMMNNRDNIANNNTATYIFIGLFSVLLFIGFICFCVFAYFKWIKVKTCLKINLLTHFALNFIVIIKITRVIIKWLLSH